MSGLAQLFRSAVEAQASRTFLVERDETGAWRSLSYGQAGSVAQALIDRGLCAERPVMILSGNSVEHALLMLAGYTAGVTVAPVSVAYSLQSQDHAKLKHIFSLLAPGLVYVADTAPFAKALATLDLQGVDIVAGRNGANLESVTLFADLKQTMPGHCHEHQPKSKEDCYLFSPAIFDPNRSTEKNRGNENILYLRHVALDFENGELHPEDLAGLFPNLQMVITNSFRHTRDKPRFRAVFFTDKIMTPKVYGLIYGWICRQAGRSWSKHWLLLGQDKLDLDCPILGGRLLAEFRVDSTQFRM